MELFIADGQRSRLHLARRQVGALIGSIGLVTLAACGGDGTTAPAPVAAAAPAAEATTTTAPVVASTVAQAPGSTVRAGSPTTTSSAVPPTVPSPASSGGMPIGPATPVPLNCPVTGPSVGYGHVRSIDFDGNGSKEIFRTYQLGTVWHVALEDGSGHVFDDEVATVLTGVVFPQGGADVNGDGTEEAWLVVGTSAGTATLTIYTLVGCNLTRVFDGGQPANYQVGATVTYLYGVKCADHNGDGVLDVIWYYGTSTNGITYTVQASAVTVTPQGTITPLLSPPAFTTTNPGMYSQFDCGPLHGVQVTG